MPSDKRDQFFQLLGAHTEGNEVLATPLTAEILAYKPPEWDDTDELDFMDDLSDEEMDELLCGFGFGQLLADFKQKV